LIIEVRMWVCGGDCIGDDDDHNDSDTGDSDGTEEEACSYS